MFGADGGVSGPSEDSGGNFLSENNRARAVRVHRGSGLLIGQTMLVDLFVCLFVF